MNELIDLGILTTSLWIFLRLLPLLFFFSFHFIFIPLDFFVLFCKSYFWWWWWSIVYFCFLSIHSFIHSFVDHNHHWCDNLMIRFFIRQMNVSLFVLKNYFDLNSFFGCQMFSLYLFMVSEKYSKTKKNYYFDRFERFIHRLFTLFCCWNSWWNKEND